tara:strand:- start:78 stop:584 length:507 start_codon:yes stop_codon:yes gene_type:complete
MKLLFENWRGYLAENTYKPDKEIDQLSQMIGSSAEETIAHRIMTHDWGGAWKQFHEWYVEGKVDLDLLIDALDRLLRDEYKRIRKNMINTDWDKTMRSVSNFILGIAHPGRSQQFPVFYNKFNKLRIYEPRMRLPWEEGPKDLLHNGLTTTLLQKRIKIKEKPDEAPT